MSPKTILFVIDGLSGGGAERVVLTLAEAMVQAGCEVTLLSLRKEQAYSIPVGVSFVVLEDTYRGPLWRLTEISRRTRALDIFLTKNFPQKKWDLIVSHLPKTDRIVARARTLRDAWFCLHCALTAGELENKIGLKRWLKQQRLIKIYNGKKIITVSRALQEDVLALGITPKQMVTIYNPLDLEKVRAAALEPCPLTGEKFSLHVGRFNAQKRHDRLFEAFKISGYPGKLVLLGQGSPDQKAALEMKAKELGILERLVFVGFVANPYSYMHASEALILSSDYEGLPNVLVEALACGTQVISTNCPYGPAEILSGSLASGLSELTATGLAAAIQRVLASPVPITSEMVTPFLLAQSVENYLSL